MKIQVNEETPIDTFPYLEVSSQQLNNGQPLIVHKTLPIYLGTFEHPDATIDYLIICSDLQGVIEKNGEYILMGEVLPEYLRLLLEIELEISDTAKIGVLLCGDLYTDLSKRGASGDVSNVWLKFNETFDWVIGVAGNHDLFGTLEEFEAFKQTEGLHLLHQNNIKKDGLEFGGISGIIGRADKVNRVDEKEYLTTLKQLLKKDLDLTLLHETPDYPPKNFIGNTKIRETIENAPQTNIACGHCYWEETIVEFENQSIVMNVDSKVVVLKRKEVLSDKV